MNRRGFMGLMGGLGGALARPGSFDGLLAKAGEQRAEAGIIGMYIHQHWPYNHPYSARTWTVGDYHSYAEGLTELGYNTLMIWPLLETVPSPLTASDRANLDKIAQVIDMLHRDFKMRVWIALCPNVAANDQEAAKYTFARRHFFYCDTRVNPADAAAMRKMMAWREELLRPLAKIDGVAIIDSDPGGYPGSTNDQFVNLLAEHRKMLDQLRPGIELYYWMHAGWQAYARFYRDGRNSLGDGGRGARRPDPAAKAQPGTLGDNG